MLILRDFHSLNKYRFILEFDGNLIDFFQKKKKNLKKKIWEFFTFKKGFGFFIIVTILKN